MRQQAMPYPSYEKGEKGKKKLQYEEVQQALTKCTVTACRYMQIYIYICKKTKKQKMNYPCKIKKKQNKKYHYP